eukprot:c19516_g1_i1 orf=416-1258(-)
MRRHAIPIAALGSSVSSLTPPFMAAASFPPPSGKRQRKVFTNSLYGKQFEQYSDELDAVNEKRERLVKLSRDMTMHSKKVIFQVHRLNSNNKELVLEQAERDLGAVKTDLVRRIAMELQGMEFWKFRKAYTPGMQEYVEAATLLEYCKSGKLLTLEDINKAFSELKDASNSPITLNLSDYLLGVGDLTGELMRLAISQAADGETEMAKDICSFVRSLYVNLSLLAHDEDDTWEMSKKMDTMLQSLIKIENTCYAVHIRGSEHLHGTSLTCMEHELPAEES